jgi:hypothetical protein
MKYYISIMLSLVAFFMGGYTMSTHTVETKVEERIVNRDLVQTKVVYAKYNSYWSTPEAKAFKLIESACHKAYHFQGKKLCLIVINKSGEPFKTNGMLLSLGIIVPGNLTKVLISNRIGELSIDSNSHYCAITIEKKGAAPILSECWDEGNWPSKILTEYFIEELQGNNPVLWEYPVEPNEEEVSN